MPGDQQPLPRICVIGCGPSGLSFLYHVIGHNEANPTRQVEVVCYEKQETFGGLWNFDWRTGLDQYGEYVHGSMYHGLFSNGPKEASVEYPDYTYMDHFGKPITSFPKRDVIRNYLEGRFLRRDILRHIRFSHVVKNVYYDENAQKFTVSVKDLVDDKVRDEPVFDYVVNCTGHFSVPNVPYLKGIETFPGRVMHSHDFRDARQFEGQTILVIGSSYSAEDLALQCVKYGAKSVVCSYRTKAMDFKWPKKITEKPLAIKVNGRKVIFKDETVKEFDAIILATGYLHHYPYFPDNMRLTGPNILYPDNLYKGTVWTKAGDGRVLYIGAQDQYYTFSMFDAQAFWALKWIIGEIKNPGMEKVQESIKEWMKKAPSTRDVMEEIDFQTDFAQDLAQESNYGYDMDVAHLFKAWEIHKAEDIVTYRDRGHLSIYSKVEGTCAETTFMKNY